MNSLYEETYYTHAKVGFEPTCKVASADWFVLEDMTSQSLTVMAFTPRLSFHLNTGFESTLHIARNSGHYVKTGLDVDGAIYIDIQ